jgi:hypothetical protein
MPRSLYSSGVVPETMFSSYLFAMFASLIGRLVHCIHQAVRDH